LKTLGEKIQLGLIKWLISKEKLRFVKFWAKTTNNTLICSWIIILKLKRFSLNTTECMQFNYWRDNELQIAILQKKTTPMIKKWKLEIQKRNKNIRFKLLEGGGGGYLKFERYFDYHRNLLQISWRVLSCRWTRSYYCYSFIIFFIF